MADDTWITIGIAFGSAVIGAVATLAVPLIQKKIDNRGVTEEAMFRYWRAAFDRSAFRGPFIWQSDQQRFDQAIRDTIQSINTGYTPSQNPALRGAPKSYLHSAPQRKTMDQVADHLVKITWALSGRMSLSPDQVAILADQERDAAISLFNTLLASNRIDLLDIPTAVRIFRNDDEKFVNDIPKQ